MQAAKPNPTQATPIHKIISGKPIINVQGCPPIAEVMAGVLVHLLTFDRIPQLDSLGRPKAFYSRRVHDTCYRRPNYDAGLVRRVVRRRERAQRILPVQGRLSRADHLQLVRHDPLERRREFPDPVRTSVHRLLGSEFLGQRPVLSALANFPGFGIEVHRRQGGDCGVRCGGGAVPPRMPS